MICGDCAYSNLTPAQQSKYMLGEPLCNFFDGLTDMCVPEIVCAVEKKSFKKVIYILQKCTMGVNVMYVPVFYKQYRKNKGKFHVSFPKLV